MYDPQTQILSVTHAQPLPFNHRVIRFAIPLVVPRNRSQVQINLWCRLVAIDQSGKYYFLERAQTVDCIQNLVLAGVSSSINLQLHLVVVGKLSISTTFDEFTRIFFLVAGEKDLSFLTELITNIIIGRFGSHKRRRYVKLNPALEPRMTKEIRRLGFGMGRRRLETRVII